MHGTVETAEEDMVHVGVKDSKSQKPRQHHAMATEVDVVHVMVLVFGEAGIDSSTMPLWSGVPFDGYSLASDYQLAWYKQSHGWSPGCAGAFHSSNVTRFIPPTL